MINKLQQFLNEYFNGLELRPPLFYLSENGIRFEIADPELDFEDERYFHQIHERAISIFQMVFNANDKILLVTDFNCHKNNQLLQRKPLKIYQKFINDRKKLTNLHHKKRLSVYVVDDDEQAEYVTHRFVLACKTSEVRYAPLLKAIGYEDFHHPSRILKPKYMENEYNVYFVNVTKKLIFHLYDDRGCDVIASNKEDIRHLYEKYNEWILPYDRVEIERGFLCKS